MAGWTSMKIGLLSLRFGSLKDMYWVFGTLRTRPLVTGASMTKDLPVTHTVLGTDTNCIILITFLT